MIILYDIQMIQELLHACQVANSEMQRAQGLIQEVHSHNDWTCKEKNIIDDLMRECRTIVGRLCEEQSSFLEAVKIVESELADAEKNVSNLFHTVENTLSQILAIPVAEKVSVGNSFLDTVGKVGERAIDTVESIANGIWSDLKSEINVVSFGSLDL